MSRSQELEAIRKRWTPPRELDSSTPREVQFSAGGKFLAGLGIALVLGALVGGPMIFRESLRQRANYRAILAEGRETGAQVLRLWQKKGENKRNMVEYRFEFEGRSYRKEAGVPTALWKTLRVDDPIRVTFLPSNPETSHLQGRLPRPLPIWVAIAVTGFTLICAAGIALALTRSKELLADGRVAPGVITKVRKYRTEHGALARTFYYEFPVLSGAVAKGKCSSDRKGLDVGSVVSVLYDPNQTGRCSMYPMQLVKVRRDT
jgi:hypothetical protein